VSRTSVSKGLSAGLSRIASPRLWPFDSEMQVFGDRELLDRNLGPMLFQKIGQLGRVATDILAETAVIPDVDARYVERVWPLLVTAGELIQTEMLWEEIDGHTPDGLRATRV